jgi:hypothetical protein
MARHRESLTLCARGLVVKNLIWLVFVLAFACKARPGDQSSGVKDAYSDEDPDADHTDRDWFNRQKQLFSCETAPGSALKTVRIVQMGEQIGQAPIAPGHGATAYWTDRTTETHGATVGLTGECQVGPYEGDENDRRFGCFILTDSFGERPDMKIYWPRGVQSAEAVPANSPVEIMEPGFFYQSVYQGTCKRLY